MILEDRDLLRRDSARRIRDAAARMVEMAQNFLDANRIERGEIN